MSIANKFNIPPALFETIKRMNAEETEYQEKVKALLKKKGFTSIGQMSPEEKKDFFNTLDSMHKAKNEEVEEIDEVSKSKLGDYVRKAMDDEQQTRKRADSAEKSSKEVGKSFMKDRQDALIRQADKRRTGINRAITKLSKEEVEEQVDQIITENNSFEIEVPAQLSYKDYLDAAMQFVDAEDALTVAEAFYNEQDESLVIESFVRSDIEQKVAVHQKAGNQVSMPKFGTKDGKPYAEYVVTNKDDGIRRKYIHHGTMRRVENMGARGKKDAD